MPLDAAAPQADPADIMATVPLKAQPQVQPQPPQQGADNIPTLTVTRQAPAAKPAAPATTPAPAAPAAAATATPAAPQADSADVMATVPPATPPPPPSTEPPSPTQQIAQKPPTTEQELRNQPWYQGLWDFVQPYGPIKGAVSEAMHHFYSGFDEVVLPIGPALKKSFEEGIPFSQAYDQAVAELRGNRKVFESNYPQTARYAGLGGDVEQALTLRKLYKAREGSLFSPEGMQTAVRNIGAGTVQAGVSSFGEKEGNLAQRAQAGVEGAEAGLFLGPIAEVAAPAVKAVVKVGRDIINAFRPQSLAEQKAGQVLKEVAGGGSTTVRPSPVPGFQQTTGEATGNAGFERFAGGVRQEPKFVAEDELRIADRNQQVRNAVPSTPTTEHPTVESARASTAAERRIKQARDIIRTEEERVWNKPSLTKPTISTSTSKKMVGDAWSDIKRTEAGLADAAEKEGTIPRILRDLDDFAPKMSAQEINSIRSRFLRLARDPSAPGDVRLAARKLAAAAEKGLWGAPEVVGVAAPGIPTGRTILARDANGILRPTPEMSGAIRPDPELVRDMKASRAFTKQEAEVLNHDSFENIFRRNSSGNATATEGVGLDKFFDFQNGVMKPGGITNLTKFLDDIKSSWSRLSAAERAGKYNPATIGPVMNDLRQNTWDFLMSQMMERASQAGADIRGQPRIAYAALDQWITRNLPMLERSGIGTPAQLAGLRRLGQLAERINAATTSGRTPGSDTWRNIMSGRTWLDVFMSPWVARVAGVGVGAGLGYVLGDTSLGGILPAVEGGAAGGTAMEVLQRMYESPREMTQRFVYEGLNNPDIAKDLMQKASRQSWARFSPATQAFLKAFMMNQLSQHPVQQQPAQ